MAEQTNVFAAERTRSGIASFWLVALKSYSRLVVSSFKTSRPHERLHSLFATAAIRMKLRAAVCRVLQILAIRSFIGADDR